jgi:hypothetical protein
VSRRVAAARSGRELELLRDYPKLGDKLFDVPQLTLVVVAGVGTVLIGTVSISTVSSVCCRHVVAGFHGRRSPRWKETESRQDGWLRRQLSTVILL